MPRADIAPLAPEISLQPGYVLRLLAIHPVTGADVSGVTVSNVSMQVSRADQEPEPAPVEAFVPLFTYGGV